MLFLLFQNCDTAPASQNVCRKTIQVVVSSCFNSHSMFDFHSPVRISTTSPDRDAFLALKWIFDGKAAKQQSDEVTSKPRGTSTPIIRVKLVLTDLLTAEAACWKSSSGQWPLYLSPQLQRFFNIFAYLLLPANSGAQNKMHKCKQKNAAACESSSVPSVWHFMSPLVLMVLDALLKPACCTCC